LADALQEFRQARDVDESQKPRHGAAQSRIQLFNVAPGETPARRVLDPSVGVANELQNVGGVHARKVVEDDDILVGVADSSRHPAFFRMCVSILKERAHKTSQNIPS
jgi:hypothetical protein